MVIRLQLARKVSRAKDEVMKVLHKVFKEFACPCGLRYIGIARRTSEATLFCDCATQMIPFHSVLPFSASCSKAHICHRTLHLKT